MLECKVAKARAVSRHRALEFAAFGTAVAVGSARLLIELIKEDGGAAIGASLGHGFFPGGELAIRVPAASVERSAFGAAHHNFTGAALFRTRNAESLLLDVSALRVVAASRKRPIAAVLDDKVAAVLGTFLVQHLVCDGCGLPFLHNNFLRVSAFRIARASKEKPETAALDGHGLAALFANLLRHFGRGRAHGRADAVFGCFFRGQVARAIAIRITRAGQKLPIPAQANVHGLPALLAHNVGGDALALDVFHFALGYPQVFLELFVEPIQRVGPGHFAVFDLVQLFFHARGIGEIENVAEVFYQQVADHHAELGGIKTSLGFFHVSAVLDHGKNGGISRRPADAFFFQGFYQGRFVVTRRRLGEMLFGKELMQPQGFAMLHERKPELQLLVVLHFRFLVLAFFVDRPEAVEFFNRTGGAERVLARRDVYGGLVENRRVHRRCHKALPDELVEFVLVGAKKAAHKLRRALDGGGPDRFVGVLRSFLALVVNGFRGQISIAKILFDVLPHRGQRAVRHPGGIGAHVSDEADRALFAQIHAFVKPLGQHHRFLGGEMQLAHRFLLELAGDKRRNGEFAFFLGGYRMDDELGSMDGGGVQVGARLVGNLQVLALKFHQARFKLRRVLALHFGRDGPVLAFDEGLDFALTLHNQTQSYGLYAAGGDAALYFFPQKRADLITHQAIENSAGLLGVHQVSVNLPRFFESFANGIFGNFIKEHAMEGSLLAIQQLTQVGADCLSFAVRIGSQINVICFARRGLQFTDQFFLGGNGDVSGFKILFQVNAQVFLGQIHHVAHTGLDDVLRPQIFIDGFRLGGRFDDYE